MAVLGKLLTELLTLSGYDLAAPDVQSLLVSDLEVPDVVATSLKTGLLTEESAKNNPLVKKHFTAQVLNTIDAELEDYIGKYAGFSEADKAAFKAEKSSYKRVGQVLAKVQELESKKVAPADTEALSTLKAEVARLNGQVVAKDNEFQTALAKARQDAEAEMLRNTMQIELNGRNYANKVVDKKVNTQLADILVTAELAAKGISVVRGTDGSPKLVLASSPELDYMQENKPVSYASFVDQVLGERKLLEVTPAATPEKGGGTPFNHIPDIASDGKIPAEATNFYAEQMASFSN